MEFELKELKSFGFDIFHDVRVMQEADDTTATCTFLSCDPYTTHAVQGIDSQGNQANCGRGNKEGINWIKAQHDGFERQMALYNTPEEHGGCQGCRFFIMCKSHCPGTGRDMDWRNKTDTCLTWKVSFAIYEKLMVQKGETPLSLHPDLKKYEDVLMYGYSRGVELRIPWIIKYLQSGESGFNIERYIKMRRVQMEKNLVNQHADHTDATGRYGEEYKKIYGFLP